MPPPFPCSGFGHCFCLSASSPVAVGKNRNATTACTAQIGFGLRDHHPARRTVVGSWQLGRDSCGALLAIYPFIYSSSHCLWGVRSVHRVCQPAYKCMPTHSHAHTQMYKDTHMSNISFAFESVPPMTGLIQSCIFASTKIVQCTHTHTLDQSLSPGGGWVV